MREAKEKAVAEEGAKLAELEARLEEMRATAAAVTAELEGKVAAKVAAKAAKKKEGAGEAAAKAEEEPANRAEAEAVVSSDGKVDLKKLASALSSSAGRIQAAAQEHKDSHDAHRDAHDVVVDLHQEMHAEVKKSENLIEHLQTRVIAVDAGELQANKGNAVVGQKEDAPLKKLYRPLGEGYEMAEPGVACACLEMSTPIHEYLGALSLTRYEFELAKEGYNTVGAFRQHEGAFNESDLESLGVELEPHRKALLGQIERSRLVSLHVTITSASGLPRGFPKPDKHSVRGLWGNSTRETTKQANNEGPNPEWKLGTLIFPAMDVASISQEDLTLQIIGNNKDKVSLAWASVGRTGPVDTAERRALPPHYLNSQPRCRLLAIVYTHPLTYPTPNPSTRSNASSRLEGRRLVSRNWGRRASISVSRAPVPSTSSPFTTGSCRCALLHLT